MPNQTIYEVFTIDSNDDFSIDITSRASTFIIDGTYTQTGNISITASGTPANGTEIYIIIKGNITPDGNEFNVFGSDISGFLNNKPLGVTAIYAEDEWIIGLIPYVNSGSLPLSSLPVITNAKLENSSITINGNEISLGGSTTTPTPLITNSTNTSEIEHSVTDGELSSSIATLNGSKLIDNSIPASKLNFQFVTYSEYSFTISADSMSGLDATPVTLDLNLSSNEIFLPYMVIIEAGSENIVLDDGSTLVIRGATSNIVHSQIVSSGSATTISSNKAIRMAGVNQLNDIIKAENLEMAVTSGSTNLSLTEDVNLYISGVKINTR